MEQNETARTQVGRLSALSRYIRPELGRIDIEYRRIVSGGDTAPEPYTLKLLITADEARQMSSALLVYAAAVDAAKN